MKPLIGITMGDPAGVGPELIVKLLKNKSFDFEQNVNGIIGEGTAASPNPLLGWVGSLTQFEGKKGYWVKLDTADSFKYEVCTEID